MHMREFIGPGPKIMRDKAINTGCSNILQSLLMPFRSTQSFEMMSEVGSPCKYRQVVEHAL